MKPKMGSNLLNYLNEFIDVTMKTPRHIENKAFTVKPLGSSEEACENVQSSVKFWPFMLQIQKIYNSSSFLEWWVIQKIIILPKFFQASENFFDAESLATVNNCFPIYYLGSKVRLSQIGLCFSTIATKNSKLEIVSWIG